MKKSILSALLSCLLCSQAGAEEAVEQSNRVLLYLDDIAVTESMYRQHFAQKGYELPADPEKQKALQTRVVNELVNVLLMAREAESLKLNEKPDLIEAIEISRQNLLGKALVGHYLEDINVSEQELNDAYAEIQNEADRRAEYQVSYILTADQNKANELLKQIKNNKADFAELAKQHSVDQTASLGGELGWVTADMVEPEFAEAMIKTAKGEINAEPVKTRFGWHLLKVTDVRRQEVPPLSEISDKLEQLIKQRQLMTKVESLRKKAVIKKPEDKMKQLPGIK